MPLEYLKLNVIWKLNLHFTQRSNEGKLLRKNEENQILQKRRGVLQNHVKNWSGLIVEITVLKCSEK